MRVNDFVVLVKACNVQDAFVDIFFLSGIDFFLHIWPGFKLGDVLGRNVEVGINFLQGLFIRDDS
eukprot:12647726-Ditylum_brightwellii.AAC.1